ncbi:hypothetical protein M409DRAFT_16034 [Zasmidium cellare ATCC 36951]|uniref:Uncharacterized protein n=1 Tax=Zasmidium cellare ATCC 36951 TaxID=1080233 RepID=A0A6A6D2Y5_ZASCE|nr:uncharacterized protein M409DRAFT_16034 [Zasmidium cellare ATCC 36951]KAF2173761.1 hypothetical protein M409DRAFT_16034 [Zasmidium cellare ATCC 36951]
MEEIRKHKPKRVKPSPEAIELAKTADTDEGPEDTEFKLAVLASLHPDKSQEVHLDYLTAYGGSAYKASQAMSSGYDGVVKRRKTGANGYQSSIQAFATQGAEGSESASPVVKPLTKKGKTLHLYTPKDVENHTPCSIIHNFLPKEDAEILLKELLEEAPNFDRGTFQLFDKTVQSPHTWKFYVDTMEAVKEQQTEYIYDGLYEAQVAKTTPEMLRVSSIVKEAVNKEVARRIHDFHPEGKHLKFQSPETWEPNASFVNCYDGGKENVGYHSDQLTYLGPRAIIGSLSLGVAREFRVRRIVPQEDASSADEQGQIAIHLPHNSLLVMHAEMQEEWKHSIAPAQAIDPHPLALNKRLNITYRCYKDYLHPKYTPKCKCGVSCVLRCVQKRKVTRGRYMWMCYANYTPGKKGCSYFVWAEFDEDGKPPWVEGYKGNANTPVGELREEKVDVDSPP